MGHELCGTGPTTVGGASLILCMQHVWAAHENRHEDSRSKLPAAPTQLLPQFPPTPVQQRCASLLRAYSPYATTPFVL